MTWDELVEKVKAMPPESRGLPVRAVYPDKASRFSHSFVVTDEVAWGQPPGDDVPRLEVDSY